MMGVLTSDLFIQLTTTLAHLSNMTLNAANFGGEVSNATLEGKIITKRDMIIHTQYMNTDLFLLLI